MNVMTSDAPPEDDLTHMSFKDPMWLQAFPLNVHSALDYFALSQFYDKKCNNEILKMQRLEMSLLRNLRGIEYELIHVREPALFVVRKLFRENPDKTIPRATYYILNGSIYQAPTLFNVLNSRLTSSIFYVRESLKEISSLIKFQPSDGHSWAPKSVQPDGPVTNLPIQASQQKKQIIQYDPLITSLLQKFPPTNPPAHPSLSSPAPTPVQSPPTSHPGANMPPPPFGSSIPTNNPPAANGIVHPNASVNQQQIFETQQIDLKRKLGSIKSPPSSAPAAKRRA